MTDILLLIFVSGVILARRCHRCCGAGRVAHEAMAMKALEPAPAIRMSCEVGARALKPPSNEEMAAAP
jgi:hypothetical protein